MGDSESMKLISKGNSDARLIIAQKTMESLRTVAEADAVDELMREIEQLESGWKTDVPKTVCSF